jgi:hypothetical protein
VSEFLVDESTLNGATQVLEGTLKPAEPSDSPDEMSARTARVSHILTVRHHQRVSVQPEEIAFVVPVHHSVVMNIKSVNMACVRSVQRSLHSSCVKYGAVSIYP